MDIVGYAIATMLASAGGILLADWLKKRIKRERRPARRQTLK